MMYLYLIPVHCFVADSDVVEVSVVTTELVPIPKDDATAPVLEITTSMHNAHFPKKRGESFNPNATGG